jgi:hypothetical protein
LGLVRYVVEHWPDRPLLFIPSSQFQAASTGDWGPHKFLVEAVSRALTIVEDCDPRLRDAAFVGRFLTALQRTNSKPFDAVLVLDGFNERQGGHWSSTIEGLLELLPVKGDPAVVVTTRASPWPQLAKVLRRKDLRHAEVEVNAFSETEFKAACALQGVDASAFDPETAKDLRNPRISGSRPDCWILWLARPFRANGFSGILAPSTGRGRRQTNRAGGIRRPFESPCSKSVARASTFET